MTILDLINKSAVMLNIPEVLNQDIEISSANEQSVLENNFALKRLYEFTKTVLNEIASYVPKIVEIEHQANDNSIPITAFERLAKIISIKNQFGYVKYSQLDGNIKVPESGVYTIQFKQYPQIDSVLDEIDIYSDMITEDILIYGLNSYYCLATGLFNEFNVYNRYYMDKLSKLKSLKVFAMPCRSWQWLKHKIKLER